VLVTDPTTDLLSTGQQSDDLDTEDVEACRDVVLRYHDAIDRGNATSALRFLIDNPAIEMGGERRNAEGIADFLRQREAQRDRHTVHLLVSQPVIAASPSSVTLGGRLLVLARSNAGSYVIEHVLDVSHRLQRSDGGWLIGERTARPFHG
jgi:hypothetical protein